MKQSKFTIDSMPRQEFSGFSKGEEWNGWACPYFSLEEGMKIIEATRTGTARYDSEKDRFVFMLDGEEEIYPAITEQGQKFYPIGSGAWIWEEKK